MSGADEYFLGYRAEEQARLQRQAEELAGESRWLFDRLGPLTGRRVVEIGCGPHGCLDLLSDRVGPTGAVVGVERSPEAVAKARAMTADRGLDNVEVLCGDGRSTGLEPAGFDAATVRLVLVNVPKPEEIVAEATGLVRPGGVVAFHEADWIAHVCDPPLAEWDRTIDILRRYAESKGIDLFIGRRLPRMLRDAGLMAVDSRPLIHVYGPGHSRRMILADFVGNLSERLIAEALVTRDELAALQAALRRHLDDPGTSVVSHLFVQGWGRKPEA